MMEQEGGPGTSVIQQGNSIGFELMTSSSALDDIQCLMMKPDGSWRHFIIKQCNSIEIRVVWFVLASILIRDSIKSLTMEPKRGHRSSIIKQCNSNDLKIVVSFVWMWIFVQNVKHPKPRGAHAEGWMLWGAIVLKDFSLFSGRLKAVRNNRKKDKNKPHERKDNSRWQNWNLVLNSLLQVKCMSS